MAVSLETREPFLDHRLVEFVWSLRPEIHRGNDGTKGLLRSVLRRYVPAAMIDRPKAGFSIPLADWLRGPLRDWANDLLSPAALTKEGHLNSALIDQLWRRQQSGSENNATGIWNVLMFRSWSDRWLKP